MNEHDVVRVKKTVTATPWFEYESIEVQSGWEGTIVALADTPTPCIAFNEKYRGKPFLVHLDATNLEVVKIIPVTESIQNQHWLETLSNGKNTYVTSYKGVFVEISYIDLENSDFNLTLDWYTRGEREWDGPQEEFPKDFPIGMLKWLGLWRVDSNNLFGRSNS
jgi:hypothetical protein